MVSGGPGGPVDLLRSMDLLSFLRFLSRAVVNERSSPLLSRAQRLLPHVGAVGC